MRSDVSASPTTSTATFSPRRCACSSTSAPVRQGGTVCRSRLGRRRQPPGTLQDSHCRRYDAPGDAGTERDLGGGWYDAGDYNKYTNWTAGYVVQLLRAYEENPGAFRDDYNIPESGNGVPDLLDEIKWGLDWLIRMQNADGSVLSIVGLDHRSPPSAATGPSLYGSANTSAALSCAAAYAYGARIFRAADAGRFGGYADDLADRAARAWTWANANPSVIFRNNDGASGTAGLGAGQQEVDDYGRLPRAGRGRICSSSRDKPTELLRCNYAQLHSSTTFAYPFELEQQNTADTASERATASVVQRSRTRPPPRWAAAKPRRLPREHRTPTAPSRNTYGESNSTKSAQGLISLLHPPASDRPMTPTRPRRRGLTSRLHGVTRCRRVSSQMGWPGDASRDALYNLVRPGSPLGTRSGCRNRPPPGYLVGGPNPSTPGTAALGVRRASCGRR